MFAAQIIQDTGVAASAAAYPPQHITLDLVRSIVPSRVASLLRASVGTNISALALPIFILQVHDLVPPNLTTTTLTVLIIGLATALLIFSPLAMNAIAQWEEIIDIEGETGRGNNTLLIVRTRDPDWLRRHVAQLPQASTSYAQALPSQPLFVSLINDELGYLKKRSKTTLQFTTGVL